MGEAPSSSSCSSHREIGGRQTWLVKGPGLEREEEGEMAVKCGRREGKEEGEIDGSLKALLLPLPCMCAVMCSVVASMGH